MTTFKSKNVLWFNLNFFNCKICKKTEIKILTKKLKGIILTNNGKFEFK